MDPKGWLRLAEVLDLVPHTGEISRNLARSPCCSKHHGRKSGCVAAHTLGITKTTRRNTPVLGMLSHMVHL